MIVIHILLFDMHVIQYVILISCIMIILLLLLLLLLAQVTYNQVRPLRINHLASNHRVKLI